MGEDTKHTAAPSLSAYSGGHLAGMSLLHITPREVYPPQPQVRTGRSGKTGSSKRHAAFRKTPPLVTDCHGMLGGLSALMETAARKCADCRRNPDTILGAEALDTAGIPPS